MRLWRRRPIREPHPEPPSTEPKTANVVNRLEAIADRLEMVFERLVPVVEQATGHSMADLKEIQESGDELRGIAGEVDRDRETNDGG